MYLFPHTSLFSCCIIEYVNYIYSDDFAAYESLSEQVIFSEITKDSDTCNITYAAKRRIPMTEDMFPADTCFELTAGATASFKITGSSNYVLLDKVNAFYPEAFLSSLYGGSTEGAFAERVCSIMEENCEEVWAENAYENQTECQASVDALPAADGIFVDGLSQGCRWLHSVFAVTNKDHCEHISTIPLEDVNGNIKCQNSAGNEITSVFSAAEISFFEETAMNEFGFDETMISAC